MTEAMDPWIDDDLFALDDAPEEISPATAERFARYQRQRNGGHLTPRQIRRLVRKCRDNGLCRRLCDDGTHCFLPWDHKGLCESSTGLYAPWLRDPYEGEHSPADEYLIYPEVRACCGDTYAY